MNQSSGASSGLRIITFAFAPFIALYFAAGPDVVNALMSWSRHLAPLLGVVPEPVANARVPVHEAIRARGRAARDADDHARIAAWRSSRGPF
jgi:hypothetical protein